jgi:quercetin dioxygenase-like cupin family protein
VDFAPGAKARPHRHGQAFVYAYVLKGAVRSALDDGAPTTYRAGDNWFEPPGARHPLTENASRTQAARLLVVFVANTGDALKTPDQP